MSLGQDVSHMIPFQRPMWAGSWVIGRFGVLFLVTPATVNTLGCAWVPRLIREPWTMMPELESASMVTPGSRISVSPAGPLIVQPRLYVFPVCITPLMEQQSGVF